MNEDKVLPVLKTHKLKTLKLVVNTLDKGWKTWSVQATELQLLRADRDNRKTQGLGFFKMKEEAISIVQEDIARDLYDMVASHREEITRLMQEFDNHEIDTSVQLDGYEQTRRIQTPELGAPTSSQSPPSPHNTDADNTDEDTNTETDNDNEAEPRNRTIIIQHSAGRR